MSAPGAGRLDEGVENLARFCSLLEQARAAMAQCGEDLERLTDLLEDDHHPAAAEQAALCQFALRAAQDAGDAAEPAREAAGALGQAAHDVAYDEVGAAMARIDDTAEDVDGVRADADTLRQGVEAFGDGSADPAHDSIGEATDAWRNRIAQHGTRHDALGAAFEKAASELDDDVRPAVDGVHSSRDAIAGLTATVLETLDELADAIVDSYAASLEARLPTLVDTVETAYAGSGEEVAEAATAVAEQVAGAAGAALEACASARAGAEEALSRAFEALFEDLAQAAVHGAETLDDACAFRQALLDLARRLEGACGVLPILDELLQALEQ